MWCKVAPDDGATTTNEQQQQRQQLGSNCFYTMPGLCSTDTVEFFRIVRLVCVKPTASPVTDLGLDLPPSIVYPISYETFVPDLVQRQQHASLSSVSSLSARFHIDKMKDTFAKVAAFLHHSGTPSSFCVLSPVHTGDYSRRIRQQSPFSATVSEFGDSRRFRLVATVDRAL